MNTFGLMEAIAANGLRAQKMRDGDSYECGLLKCGRCGEMRQAVKRFSNPTDEEPDRTTELKVIRLCKCDLAEEAEEERKKAYLKDMERLEGMRRASLIDSKFSGATFDNYEHDKDNEKNYQICMRYADKFDEMLQRNQGLLMYGGVGTGKSFSAACIANQLMANGVSVVMTSFPKLLELLRSEAEQNVIEKLNAAKLVIFDDLGAERNTDYAVEKVYSIIDSRYRKGLPMVVTTNLAFEDMKREDDIRYARIYDRLFETCYPIKFTGKSWRREEANKRFEEMKRFLNA